jgi:hypothetical protein
MASNEASAIFLGGASRGPLNIDGMATPLDGIAAANRSPCFMPVIHSWPQAHAGYAKVAHCRKIEMSLWKE